MLLFPNEDGQNCLVRYKTEKLQAHRGTLFVGADVDSQEQWIAGLYGDASASERLGETDRGVDVLITRVVSIKY